MAKKFLSRGKFSIRGFNMFSSIVAIILIMTGAVLTNTLISTEEKTSLQIASMLNNYQLSDAASLARADALQSFNYNFREKLENYLTFDDYKIANEPGFELFRIDSPQKTFTFDSMKNNFEHVILLTGPDDKAGEQFDAAISYVAERTVDQFMGGTYGRFNVYLSDKSQDAKTAIYNATKGAIAAQGQDFLEVVNCSDTGCKDGSFYFNIPLNKITDAQYEALPRIVVKDLVSQEEIKLAILPRTNIKVYIPLRFFKALYEARKTAYAIENSHNTLAQYNLGFCDGANICSPRTNPLVASTSSSWDKQCPVTGMDPPIGLAGQNGGPLTIAGVSSYLAGDRTGAGRALKAFGAQEICKQAVQLADPSGLNAFETDDENFTVKDTVLAPGEERVEAIGGCGLNNLNVVANPEATHLTNLGTSERLTCSRVTAVYSDIVYAETNPSYIVRGTAEAGAKDYYKIRISDVTYRQADAQSFYNTNLPMCTSSPSGSCSPS